MIETESNQKTGTESFQTGGWKAHWILIVCTLLYMVTYMDRVVIPVVQEMIKRELVLTDTQLGLLQTVLLLSTGLLSFPLGFLVDRWSRNKSMGVFGITWSFFSVVTGLATSFISLLIPRIAVGVGKAGFGPGGTAVITAAYPADKHGLVVGIFNLGMPLGMALGTIMTGYIASTMGWRAVFFILAAVGLVFSLAAFSMRDYTTRAQGISFNLPGLFRSVRDVVSLPTMRWLLVGYGLLVFTIQAQVSWMPTFFIRQFDWTTGQAANLVSLLNFTGIIGAPIGGLLADAWYRRDRRGRLWLAAIMSVASSISMILSTFFFPSVFAVGLVFGLCVGILYMVASVSLVAVTQSIVPAAHKALAYGLSLFSMYILGGAWSPMIAGLISDRLGSDAQALLWSLISLCSGGILAGICFALGSRHYIRDEEAGRRPAQPDQ